MLAFVKRWETHMTIDWVHFTPASALAGGLLIGIAAALYLLGNGRVAGISTVVGAALQTLVERRTLSGEGLRWAFIAGLLAAPWIWRCVATLPPAQIDVTNGSLVAAGLLVGVGTRMGSGCTSGHGVCGLARRSPRSLANVLAFMGAGFAGVYVLRHVL
jgi:uncharacterized membrane protein YedE/YeeE